MDDNSSNLLDGKAACQACVKQLISDASHSVYLIGKNLEPELYNDKEIYEFLSHLTTSNRHTDIRIITHDTRTAAYQGHYLIRLAQKLPTFTQIRTTKLPAHQRFRENWLIVDGSALMRLKNPERYEGYVETENMIECKAYADQFEEIWDACEPDSNSRRLSL